MQRNDPNSFPNSPCLWRVSSLMSDLTNSKLRFSFTSLGTFLSRFVKDNVLGDRSRRSVLHHSRYCNLLGKLYPSIFTSYIWNYNGIHSMLEWAWIQNVIKIGQLLSCAFLAISILTKSVWNFESRRSNIDLIDLLEVGHCRSTNLQTFIIV